MAKAEFILATDFGDGTDNAMARNGKHGTNEADGTANNAKCTKYF
jgi:hypothetical protein